MKITLILSFVLCCVIATAQEPVQLEVWTTVKSYGFDLIENPFGVGDRFAYVPNFRNNKIPHGFIVSYREPNTDIQEPNKVYTWAFAKPDDTLNQFTWPRNFFPSSTPDINADGQRDFMNAAGMFYLGTKNDEPDTTIQYKVDGNIAMIDAFNDDARDDFFLYGSGQMPNPYIAHFVFSNPTLKNFKKYSLVSKNILQDEKSEEIAKAIYKNRQGQWRLLTYCRGWVDGLYQRVWVSEKSVIRLYSLEFTTITEDSTSVTATQIDEYRDPKWMDYIPDMNTKDDFQWRPFNNQRLLYNTENYPKILYYASMNTMPDKETKKYDSYATFFDLTNDKIVPSNTVVDIAAPECKILKHSIDGDKIPEIYVKTGPNILFYSIASEGIPTNTMKYVIPEDRFKGGLRGLTSISDINNDGIHDIALMSSDNSVGNYFAIIKGKDVKNNIVEETKSTFTLNYPYPLPNSSEIVIPLFSSKTALYTLSLYNVQGIQYTLFSDKQLPEGETLYSFSTTDFGSGAYILRFSDGKNTVEKTILIQH
ncbi:MAG: T9SS type A sorting domain-containing protein [Candidatus Kapabacteria bacterium]|nr:T9SS type A sorting domain-containing protein [Candidatus Kapabacteria bacterium]